MIEKLDHYPVPDIHTVVDKINEIIDFVNDTNAMRIKDGRYITVTGGDAQWSIHDTVKIHFEGENDNETNRCRLI